MHAAVGRHKFKLAANDAAVRVHCPLQTGGTNALHHPNQCKINQQGAVTTAATCHTPWRQCEHVPLVSVQQETCILL